MNPAILTIIIITWGIGVIIASAFLMSDFYLDKKYKSFKLTKLGWLTMCLALFPFAHGILTVSILFLDSQKLVNCYDKHQSSIKKLLFKENNK